jgi:4-hydroxy-tetrahydrodipicolinate synthase
MTSQITRRSVLSGLGASVVALSLPLRSETKKPFKGIFPIVATPFTDAKAIDYEDLAGEVDFLDRCGVHGMVWPQLASEYQSLSKEERFRAMEVLARAHRGKKSALVFGVQGETKEAALEYASYAEKLQPDALIAIPPRQAKTLDDYRDYYGAIARATGRPVFVQTTGGAPGLEPKTTFLISLAKEFPNLGYIKEEWSPVIPRMIELAAKRPAIQSVFSGNGGRGMMYEWRLGMDGTMPGSPYADLYVQVWDAYQAGDKDKAREIFSKLLLMLNCESQVEGTRQYIMKKRGVFKTTVSRMRSFTLTPEAVAEIEYHWQGCQRYLKT